MHLVLQKANAKDYKVLNEILTVEKQGLAMARGDTDFRLAVDAALSELYQDGTMRAIFAEKLPNIEPGLALEVARSGSAAQAVQAGRRAIVSWRNPR